MFDLDWYKIENQNLKEIIEVGKQISSGLNISHIVKNVNYIISSKFNSDFLGFILPADFDDFSPDCYFYSGTRELDPDIKLPSVKPLLDYFKAQECNQISFKNFHHDFKNKSIMSQLEKYKPDFILPLKSDSDIVGIYLQGERKDGKAYSIEDIQFCTNIINFASIAIENANLYRAATIDRMTKLYTHHQFKKKIDEEIAKGLRYEKIFSLIMFDIDHFKKFNDTYGHLIGDAIIKEIAAVLIRSIREVDYPARYGGEEFAIILPEIPIKNASKIAERLRSKIEKHDFIVDAKTFKVTISTGVAEYIPQYIKFREDLIEAADKALYLAKNSGRNKISINDYKTGPILYHAP